MSLLNVFFDPKKLRIEKTFCLPEPVSVPIPATIHLQPDFGEEMMKKESPVPFKIAQLLAMGMGSIVLGQGLGQGLGFSGLAGNTNEVKMDRMIKLVFAGNDHNGIVGYFFIHGDIDAQEKSDHKETDQDNGNNLKLFTHALASINNRIIKRF
jgi:hypothetical protein